MSSPSEPTPDSPDSPGEADPGFGPRPSAAPPVSPRGSRATSTVVLLVSAALYSLIVAGILLVLGAFMVWMFQLGESGSSLAAGVALGLLLVGGHRALLAALRRADLPHPEATTALLTASVVLMFGQTALLIFVSGVGTFLSVPLTAFLQGMVVAVALAVIRRRTLTWACVAVCVFLLSRSLTSFGLATLDAHQEQQEDLEALASYPYEIAVLDAPGWTPVSVSTRYGDERMLLFYENADGDGLNLTTWGTYTPGDTPDRPLWTRCEGYSNECTETPEGVVLREGHPEVSEPDTVRLEVAPGRVAVLEQRPVQVSGSLHGQTLPDISLDELHELAERVRVAEEGEVEEIVERTG